MKRNYIGLGTSPHDPSIAIVDERGAIVFAEGCERYLQNKRAWGSPPDDFVRIRSLIREYCSPDADLVIAASWHKRFFQLVRFAAFGPLRGVMRRHIGAETFSLFRCIAAYVNVHHGENTECQFSRLFERRKVIRREYEHHLTHSAAVAFSSPCREAVSVVIDGLGEGTSSSVFHFDNGRHRKIPAKRSVASLGDFYSFLCELCGFDPIKGEEWKVMGLAPYGKLNERYHSLLSDLIRIDDLSFLPGRNAIAARASLLKLGRRERDPASDFADLAFTGQQVFCDIVSELLANVYRYGFSDNLLLSGGCALNSACVGGLPQRSKFKQSHVFCAPADDGNAVGAALLAYHDDSPNGSWEPRVQVPYLGSQADSERLDFLTRFGNLTPLAIDHGDEFYRYVARALSEGKIVGWFQGRAEFGPRALGNRSILADPRREDIKEVINARVKFREEYRPFAPSILAEFGPDYFEDYCDTPYMERALKFRPSVRSKVPGVVHVDGTGRLQTVKREWNEPYYRLISDFHKITGVPLVLNTSFNVMGKPIVHSVEDAVAVFFTTGLDLLVIEQRIFDKSSISKLAFSAPLKLAGGSESWTTTS
jgi:carbamoyltransferase